MIPARGSLLKYRLIVVTGKGGVGKTTVSCALAEAARRAGKRVLLAETAAIESAASRFEARPAPLGYSGRVLRPGLHAMRVDPHEALADYVRLQTGLGAVTDRVLQTKTFQQFLEAAPGWRELITLGRIWHLEQQRDDRGEPLYDLLIVDAPATGHGLTFLDVPRVVQQAVRAGPLSRHAGWVEKLVHDRERTLLLPVTLPEELPVTETAELVERARAEIDIAVDRIIVNRLPAHPDAGLGTALEALPKDLTFEVLPALCDLRKIIEHAHHRNALARAQRARVSERCQLPVVDMPNLPNGCGAKSGWAGRAHHLLEDPVWPDAATEGASAA
ncbi:MAG: ArsA family ATPase [bacterium]|nr:ArsA family ATPase [bacterium]